MTNIEREEKMNAIRKQIDSLNEQLTKLHNTKTPDEKKLLNKYKEKFEGKFVVDPTADGEILYVKKIKGFAWSSDCLGGNVIYFYLDDDDGVCSGVNNDACIDANSRVISKETVINRIEKIKLSRCKELDKILVKINSL